MRWTVSRETIPGEVNGLTIYTDRRVIIDESLSPAQAAKTSLHEAAHAILHADSRDRNPHQGIRETEAEPVAYTVAGAFGLDTASYSIGYIASSTNGDTDLIAQAAANTLRAARILTQVLDNA